MALAAVPDDRLGIDAPAQPRSLLLVVDHFYPYVGGSETLFWNATRTLAQRGWKVHVVTRRDANFSRHEVLEGVEITRVSTPEFAQRLFFQLLALPLVWQLGKSADIIHAVVYASALPGWLTAFFRGKPFVLTVHEVFGKDWSLLTEINAAAAFVLRAFEWLLLHLPRTCFHCPTEFTARRLREVGGVASNRVKAIHNVIDYEFWNPARFQPRDLRAELHLPPDCFMYLYFGRPGASKGVEYLLHAVHSVADAVPNSRLVLLLGRDPAPRYARLLEMISELHIKEHVTILEPVPQKTLPEYLLAADCVVVPSLSEGFGYSAIEAATLGCRVISTTGHAVEEVLAGDVDLVPPRDPSALATAIVNVARNPVPRQPTTKRYDAQTHLEKFDALYRELLSGEKCTVSS